MDGPFNLKETYIIGTVPAIYLGNEEEEDKYFWPVTLQPLESAAKEFCKEASLLASQGHMGVDQRGLAYTYRIVDLTTAKHPTKGT